MAGLSSNWKKLQAKLKAEPASKPPPSLKRKADDDTSSPAAPAKTKRAKSTSTSAKAGLGSKRAPRDSVLKRANTETVGTGAGRGKMGAAQSSLAHGDQKHGVSPSIALWGGAASSNGGTISAEALAEAYQLGAARDGSSAALLLSARGSDDRVNAGLTAGIDVGKYIAMDCEMVGVGAGGRESALARVSVVDFHGRQVYDSFVRPRARVTDWRTPVSGISPRDMRFARDFSEVRADVAALLSGGGSSLGSGGSGGRILIGHDVRHDLEALQLSHPARDTRDTARHAGFRRHAHGRKPALRVLARTLLDVEIQDGAHSSLEDARATMLLFRRSKPEFDVDHANRYAPRPAAAAAATPGGGGAHAKRAKKKKKR